MSHPARPAPPTLFKELTASKAMHTCILTDNKYISEQKVHEIVTVPRVRSTLRSRWGWLLLLIFNRGLDNKLLQARKVIAVLVIIGQLNEDSLMSLTANGLTDDDLPLRDKGDSVQNRHENKTVTFPSWEEGTMEACLEKQWIVLAPILDLKDGHPIEFELDEKCALEFSICEDQGKTQFSQVFFAEIPSQIGERRHIAIKKFINAFKDYTHERDNLRKINAVNNNHLIKHLATCDQMPCIVFPWADHGDLKQFWEDKSASDRALPIFVWSIEQLYGLASALRDLHNINCRHGDLKPSNIFYFSEDGAGVLKIADVGVSKIHSISTHLHRGETATTASTRAYEGPEAYRQTNAPRSRTYDCWSMGCIILEFVIWLLYDQNALDGFHWSRDSEWNSYYYPKSSKPISDDRKAEWWEEMERHPNVDVVIKLLLEDGRVRGTALEELVNIVDSKLLLINPKSRHLAIDIAKELQGLLGRCKKEQIPWVNLDEVPPTVPSIFSHAPPKVPDTTCQPNGVTVVDSTLPAQQA
ncbi:hypothetical protein QQX98_002694 [Neonectria punicea]|uniref:Protein kinase domain-containing protein n=1 Tax=Neonectria punicea TaxID=979145 RepID=A0ABR1HIW8_9HYPO